MPTVCTWCAGVKRTNPGGADRSGADCIPNVSPLPTIDLAILGGAIGSIAAALETVQICKDSGWISQFIR